MPINESTKFELLGLVEQLRDAILKAAGEDQPLPGPVPPPAKPITSVTIENTGGDQTNVPVTFGQVFAPGDLPAGIGLKDAQLDVKATHPDGSVRHGIVSLIVPKLDKGEKTSFALVPIKAEQKGGKQVDYVDTLVALKEGEKEYLSMPLSFNAKKWLEGSVVSEMVYAPELLSNLGDEHPHLKAYFSIRTYSGGRARVDVCIENDWAYEPNPRNFSYDVEISLGEDIIFSQKNLTHYHHARWRHVAWIGEEPKVHVKHDTAYLIKTRAVPNYDQSIVFPEKTLAEIGSKWEKAQKAPMDTGFTMRAMPTTGGRSDIGILPSWTTTWLLTMDKRPAQASLGTGDLAGGFPMHYRDKDTGQPISLIDYPYMTLLGNPGDTFNPVTKKREIFPTRADKVKPPNIPDISHHPNVAYVPYLLTGDLYYLEELQFWAMYCAFSGNPGYRQNVKGLVKPEQVRGQAWALRTIAEAAYITPDADRLKPHFNQIMDSNLDWFNAEYTDNPNANKLGVLENGYAVVYLSKTGVAPWQDDFFTQAVGHAAELGFDKAKKLIKWKSIFPTQRMIGEGMCWIYGAAYSLKIKPAPDAPAFSTIGEVYRATFPDLVNVKCGGEEMQKLLKLAPGEMDGYANGATGYPSNMQPALAYAADALGEEGKKAWKLFMDRAIKPDYSKGPQFAIVPRSV